MLGPILMTDQNIQSYPEPEGIWRIVDRTLDTVALICKLITGVSLVVLTVIFGWLVYGRYILNATPTWVEQVSFLLIMLIAFLGAAVGVHENTHLSVSAFRTASPKWMRLTMIFVSDVIMACFGTAMVWYGTKLTLFKWGSQIPLIDLPEGLRTVPLTVGGGLILVFSLAHLARSLRGVDQRTDTIE